MQLSEIRSLAREIAGVGTSDPAASDSLLTNLVNASVRRFASQRNWPWDVTLLDVSFLVDTNEYALPADFRSALSVRNEAQSFRLQPMTGRNITRLRSQSAQYPTHWSVDGPNLVLLPTPASDGDIVMEYLAFPDTLSADADEPDVPDGVIDWVVTNTAQMLAIRLHDYDLAKVLGEQKNQIMYEVERHARRMQITSISYRRDWSPRIS